MQGTRHWLSWLGFLKPLLLCLAIASGSLGVVRDGMFLVTGTQPGDAAAAFWAYIRICFVVASAITWALEHKKVKGLERSMEPHLEIKGPSFHEWEDGALIGRGYYFDIFNASYTETIENVRAELISINPDVVQGMTLPMKIKHDSPSTREFSINPRAVRQVDFMTGPTANPKSQQPLILTHTIPNGTKIPNQRYRLTFGVSAKHVSQVTADFDVWTDAEGLKCMKL